MLVLTRYTGEDIVIGNDVRVTVLAVKGNKVRIGITAPSPVHVARGELLDRYTRPDLSEDASINSKNSAGAQASENC